MGKTHSPGDWRWSRDCDACERALVTACDDDVKDVLSACTGVGTAADFRGFSYKPHGTYVLPIVNDSSNELYLMCDAMLFDARCVSQLYELTFVLRTIGSLMWLFWLPAQAMLVSAPYCAWRG